MTLTETLQKAAQYLAGHDQDWASVNNSAGYSKADGSFGHSLAVLPLDQWDDEVTWAAYDMLRHYKGQLAAVLDFDTLPVPPKADRKEWRSYDNGFASTEVLAGREKARNATAKARKAADIKAKSSIDYADGLFLIKTPYDPDMVSAQRAIPGRQWDGRVNTAPVSSALHVAAFAEKFGIALTPAAQTAIDVKLADVPKDPTTGKPAAPKDTVDLKDGKFAVTFYGSDFLTKKDGLKALRIGATWHSVDKVWYVPVGASEGSKLSVWASHNGVVLTDAAKAKIDSMVAEHEVEVAASAATDADVELPGFNPELSPHGYQKAGIAYALKHRRAWIADDMGLGKTVQAMAAVIAGDALPALVVCPVNVLMNWPREIEKFFPGKSAYVVSGTAQADIPKGYDFYVIGHSVIGDRWEDFLGLDLRGLVIDESHYIRNGERKPICPQCGEVVQHGAKSCFSCSISFSEPEYKWSVKRTHGCLSIARRIPADGMVLLLSGTPLKNGRAKELLNQLDCLGVLDTSFGGRSAFLRKYADAKRNSAGYFEAKGLKDPEALQEKLRATCMVRRTHKMVDAELPELVHNPVWLTIAPEKLAKYREVENDVIGHIAQRAKELAEQAGVEAVKAAAEKAGKEGYTLSDADLATIRRNAEKAGWEARLRAEAAEHLVSINALRRAAVDAKLEAVHEWVDDFLAGQDDPKLVLFGHNIDVVEGLHNRYQDRSVLVRGGTSAADRMVAQDKFQNDPKVSLFVANLTAAGEGLTLTAAYDVAFTQLDWTPAAHDQGAGRCYGRANDPHGATAHYLMAKGTCDEDDFDLLLTKRDNNGKVLDGGGSMKSTKNILGDRLVQLAKRGMQSA